MDYALDLPTPLRAAHSYTERPRPRLTLTMSINIDMSFLDAPARGGAASRHLEETCVLRSNLIEIDD